MRVYLCLKAVFGSYQTMLNQKIRIHNSEVGSSILLPAT